jgi:hypothetical protein
MSRFHTYKIKEDEGKCGADNTMYDPFGFQTCNYKTYAFDDDEKRIQSPLELVKAMLVLENDLRLSGETIAEYAKSQSSPWKTKVTQELQERVVLHFMPVSKFYKDLNEGLMFLRSAVGNFPNQLEELMECANYVKYTQHCVRGTLQVGDRVGGKIPSDLPVYDLSTLAEKTLGELLSQEKPNVIVSSSYT